MVKARTGWAALPLRAHKPKSRADVKLVTGCGSAEISLKLRSRDFGPL